jgi:hypothetical protein
MSHKVVQIVPLSTRLLRIAKRIVVGLGLVAVGYVGAHVAPSPVDNLFAAAISTASTRHSGVDPSRPPPSPNAPGVGASQRDFDYFPDHYQNQARDVAPPVDQF